MKNSLHKPKPKTEPSNNPPARSREEARKPLALGVSEAAKSIGISRATLYRHIKDRLIPAHKCGQRTLLLISEIEHYLTNLPLLHGDAPVKNNEQG